MKIFVVLQSLQIFWKKIKGYTPDKLLLLATNRLYGRHFNFFLQIDGLSRHLWLSQCGMSSLALSHTHTHTSIVMTCGRHLLVSASMWN